MDDDWVIKVENLNKKFTRSLKRSMAYGFHDTLKNMLGFKINEDHLRKSEFWALQDVNFTLKKGESLGLIGRNGCGKSTLLRLINGIFPPSKGRIQVKGRMGALIAVGAGFHPHMTGYENIYLNGTILGMSSHEIDEKIHQIIEFAEINEFIHAPVSTYSSGMIVRLGFSIAVHADVDILLADEVLAVGDINFRKKSMDKILELKKQGTSIIFVSHENSWVERLCEQAIFFDKGQIIMSGETLPVLNKYQEFLAHQQDYKTNNSIFTSGDVIEFISFEKQYDGPMIDFSETIQFELRYKVKQPVKGAIISLWLTKNSDKVCMAWDTDENYALYEQRFTGSYRSHFSLEAKYLTPGYYNVCLGLAYESLGYIQTYYDVEHFIIYDKFFKYQKTTQTRADSPVSLPIKILTKEES